MSRRKSLGGGPPSQPNSKARNFSVKRYQSTPPPEHTTNVPRFHSSMPPPRKEFERSFSIQTGLEPKKPPKVEKVRRRIPSKADVEAFRKRAKVVFNRLAPDGTLPVHSIKTSLQSLGFKVVEDAGRAINELQYPVEICDMQKGAKITTIAVLRMQARILLCRPECVGIIMYIM